MSTRPCWLKHTKKHLHNQNHRPFRLMVRDDAHNWEYHGIFDPHLNFLIHVFFDPHLIHTYFDPRWSTFVFDPRVINVSKLKGENLFRGNSSLWCCTKKFWSTLNPRFFVIHADPCFRNFDPRVIHTWSTFIFDPRFENLAVDHLLHDTPNCDDASDALM